MKRIKVVLGIFIFSIIFSISGVSAVVPQDWINVKLPAFSGIVEGDYYVYKTIEGQQYNNTILTQDSLTKKERAISVRTVRFGGLSSSWIDSPQGSIVTWSSADANNNTRPGDYNLQVKATRSTLASTYYWGQWHLDDTNL